MQDARRDDDQLRRAVARFTIAQSISSFLKRLLKILTDFRPMGLGPRTWQPTNRDTHKSLEVGSWDGLWPHCTGEKQLEKGGWPVGEEKPTTPVRRKEDRNYMSNSQGSAMDITKLKLGQKLWIVKEERHGEVVGVDKSGWITLMVFGRIKRMQASSLRIRKPAKRKPPEERLFDDLSKADQQRVLKASRSCALPIRTVMEELELI